MLKKILLLQLLLISVLTYGQTVKICGKVIASDKTELEYVSIGIIGKSIGTISDNNGRFVLVIDNGLISKGDSLRFSMIGYFPKTYSIKQIGNCKKTGTDWVIVLEKKIEQLRENVIIEIKGKKTGWFEVDLSKYNIIVNQNIIVSVEWVAKTGSGKKLSMPIMIPTMCMHYYKFGSQNKWRKFKSMSTPMELKIKY